MSQDSFKTILTRPCGPDEIDLIREDTERRRTPISQAGRCRVAARCPPPEIQSIAFTSRLAVAARQFEPPRHRNPFDICPVLATLEDEDAGEGDDRELDDILRCLGVAPSGH